MNGRALRNAGVLVAAAALLAVGCGQGAQDGGAGAVVSADQDALHRAKGPKVTVQQSGTTSSLIAVSALNSRVVWASGRAGTFAVTSNGGKTWHSGVVPGAEIVQFRDVEAVSEKVAYLLSVPTSPPDPFIASRIYKTTDGGKTWKLQFEAPADQFHDCFAFWDPYTGLDFADSSNGRFPAVRTFDGRTWHDYGDHLPAALPGGALGPEAGFASGGTCIATQGNRRAWITTGTSPTEPGGAWTTRVFFTTDRGQTWGVTTAPISPSGPDAVGGGFSIAFRDARHGILAGGDLGVAEGVVVPNFARSKDGGRTWTLATPAPIPGAIFTAAYAGHGTGHDGWGRDDDDDLGEHGHGNGPSIRVVATAPTATAWSPDEGQTWNVIAGLTGLWGVDFGDQQTGWLVGTGGQIVRLDF